MKCFLCSSNILYQSDDVKYHSFSRDGFTTSSRTNYSCLECQNVMITIDFPEGELYSFNIFLGSGYTLKGSRNDMIKIISPIATHKETITIPWISIIGIKDILDFLQTFSVKYETYVTFS